MQRDPVRTRLLIYANGTDAGAGVGDREAIGPGPRCGNHRHQDRALDSAMECQSQPWGAHADAKTGTDPALVGPGAAVVNRRIPLLVAQPRHLGVAAEPCDARRRQRQRSGRELVVDLDGVRAGALELVPHDRVVTGSQPDRAAMPDAAGRARVTVVRCHRPGTWPEMAALDRGAVAVGPGHLAKVQGLIAAVDSRGVVSGGLPKMRLP